MKFLKYAIFLIIAFIIWTTIIGYGVVNGFLLRPITNENTSEAFIEKTKERIKEEFVGNLAMVLIEDGEVSADYFHSIDKPIDKYTVFQMASVSKWVTAWGIFALVEEGKLDINQPIENYLTRWHLPESEFNHDEVTIRRLLAHTSGLVDDLGYEGFAPDEKVQTIEESLTKAADGFYSEGVAKIGYKPGNDYKYSGAGYTILQLIIEEVSGQSFQYYMTETVFKPLKMERSTFHWSDSLDMELATLYKSDGTISPPYRFTALAAASLYTCTDDLTKFLQANLLENPVLSAESVELMHSAEAFINVHPVHALGPKVYAVNDAEDYITGHDGSSGRPVINTAARLNLKTNDGIIILEMGSPNLASNLSDEWIFWKTGIADYVVIHANKRYLLTWLFVGFGVILTLMIYLIMKFHRKE